LVIPEARVTLDPIGRPRPKTKKQQTKTKTKNNAHRMFAKIVVPIFLEWGSGIAT
jgi:hypothetical protein